MISDRCCEFLSAEYGKRALRKFNKYKADLEDTIRFISARYRDLSPEYYLDIGAGDGTWTLEISRGIGARNIDFLEPSAEACEEFKKKSCKDFMGHVSIFPQRFEDFQADRRYGFISAIHSWYYISPNELAKLYGLLEHGAKASIFMDSKSDVIKRIQNICEKHLGEASNNLEDITGFLDKSGIRYDVLVGERVNEKVDGLIHEGDFTDKTRNIISLVSWTRWRDVPKAAKDEVLDMLLTSDRASVRRYIEIVKK